MTKICLITGANSGIGRITATEMAKEGFTVVMWCRDAARGKAARNEIIAETGNTNVELLIADLASMQQVRKGVAAFMQRYGHLDVLINNAGFLAGSSKTLTGEGFELTFAVNHLGHFLLTNLLRIPLLKAPAARIINVSSELHRRARLDFGNLHSEKKYQQWAAYSVSKYANVLFTAELAKRLRGTKVTANCLHPGVVATNFGSGGSWFINLIMPFARRFMITAAQGAETTLYLALSEEVSSVSGSYFRKKKAVESAPINVHEQFRLWQESLKMVHLSPEESF